MNSDDQTAQDESTHSLPNVPTDPRLQADKPQTVMPGNPHVAADADLIEKAWVDKAKQIVEQTKNDPYEQQKALSKFKADYIKKRYNKDVNVADN
jgi:hypothetical protein